MQKPGLGARKCGHCGARIEGPQSHLLQQCPRCRSPLYGRTVAAPPQTAGGGAAPHRGSGGLLALAGVATVGLLGVAGAIGYVAFGKKAGTPVAEPARAAPTPELAERAATPASAAPLKKAPSASAAASARPAQAAAPPTAPTASAFGLVARPSATVIASASAAPPPSSTASAAALLPQRCSRAVSVGKLRPSSPTCSFNEKVSGGPSKIEFPCEGGAATATFGTHTFRGSVTTTSFILTHNEPFSFGGCRVESSQRITGARNASTGLYSYSERIVSGVCSGVKTCTATAIVELR